MHMAMDLAICKINIQEEGENEYGPEGTFYTVQLMLRECHEVDPNSEQVDHKSN